MNRAGFETYLLETYQAQKECPWASQPHFAVFRHLNQKWFAVTMELTKDKVGLPGSDTIDVVNLKCRPELIGSLRTEPGIFPAYHMNKEHWITVALDGSVPDEMLKMLVDISFTETAPKRRKRQPIET